MKYLKHWSMPPVSFEASETSGPMSGWSYPPVTPQNLLVYLITDPSCYYHKIWKTKAEEEFQLTSPKLQQNAHHHCTLNSTITCQTWMSKSSTCPKRPASKPGRWPTRESGWGAGTTLKTAFVFSAQQQNTDFLRGLIGLRRELEILEKHLDSSWRGFTVCLSFGFRYFTHKLDIENFCRSSPQHMLNQWHNVHILCT